jgi:molybdopterin synthase catalytic subunit
VVISLSDATVTVSALLDVFEREYPVFARFRSVVRIAVNQEFADSNQLVTANDEIAVIPPVAGGG